MSHPSIEPGSWGVYYGADSCGVYPSDINIPNTKKNAISGSFDRSPESMAKARLIAASPDMLAALRATSDILGQCPPEDENHALALMVRKAITTARLPT